MSTSSNDPEELRSEIEQTRVALSDDVNALGEAITPGNIARRQASKVSSAAGGLKDRVMGSADDATSAIGDRASSVGGTVGDAPHAARQRARGNPLAAGLVAFGAGLLVGSALPATEKEKQAASTAKEKAQPLMDEAKDMAKESAQNLKQPAQDAVGEVKDTASQAADTVRSEGQQAVSDVQGSAQESSQTVKAHQERPDTSL